MQGVLQDKEDCVELAASVDESKHNILNTMQGQEDLVDDRLKTALATLDE